MEIRNVIEAMLFASGREVSEKEIMGILEIDKESFDTAILELQNDYINNRGMEIIKIEDSYQMCTKKENYEYIYPLFDNRSKPNLSNAALETLSIVAYNPKVTRAEIDKIRGVNSDGTIYKLLEYNMIEEVGRLDTAGRPTIYSTTTHFLKTFGIEDLSKLPKLPKYKLDENEQIVLERSEE